MNLARPSVVIISTSRYDFMIFPCYDLVRVDNIHHFILDTTPPTSLGLHNQRQEDALRLHAHTDGWQIYIAAGADVD